jgi:hypothetical protein
MRNSECGMKAIAVGRCLTRRGEQQTAGYAPCLFSAAAAARSDRGTRQQAEPQRKALEWYR